MAVRYCFAYNSVGRAQARFCTVYSRVVLIFDRIAVEALLLLFKTNAFHKNVSHHLNNNYSTFLKVCA